MKENVLLASYTTLRVGGPARYFFTVKTLDDVTFAAAFAKKKNIPIFILGGGSNVLVSDKGFSGVVIKNEIKGVTYEDQGDTVRVSAGAGVVWDDLVADSASRNLWGFENLSGIPGTVGASPIQNIGAYGAEIKDYIVEVRVYDTTANKEKVFSNSECVFGYRDSMFKKSPPGRYIILSCTYTLKKSGTANVKYADLAARFSSTNEVRPIDIRNTVLSIRSGKIPSPNTMPNAGSFFKNPVISEADAERLTETYPDIRIFPQGGGVKVSAAWLIDHVGKWKGIIKEGVFVCDTQPLVITHTSATAHAILMFADEIINDIKAKTGITLEREVGIIGNFL